MIRIRNGAINWRNPVKPGGLNDGLVSWWLARGPWVGGGTWFDLCGKKNGTLSNGATWGTRPGSNMAVVCDGSNDYVALPSFAVLTGAYSVVFWQKATTLAQNGIWFSLSTATIPIAAGIYNTGNKIFVGNATSNLGLSTISSYLTAGDWMQVAVLVESTSSQRIFVNGVEKSVSNISDYYTAVSTNIGARNDGATFPFSGSVDDFRIYNRILTTGDVWKLYEDSLAGYTQTLNRLERRFGYAAAAASFSPWYALNQSQYARVT